MNQNIRLRNLRQQFIEVAQFFDKDIWFVKKDNSILLSHLHSSEEIIKELFFYFDLINVGIFDLKEYYIMASLFVKGSFAVSFWFWFFLIKQKFLKILIVFFGNRNKKTISRNEFYYFVDCLFRGLSKAWVHIPASLPFDLSFNDSQFEQLSINQSLVDQSTILPGRGEFYRMKTNGKFFLNFNFRYSWYCQYYFWKVNLSYREGFCE